MTKGLTRARRHWRLRSATALAAIGALVLTSGGVLMSTAAADQPADRGGNNGTLKVLNATSGEEFKNNEPKVCTFRFEGFGFDALQSGELVLSGQGRTTYSYSFGTVAADGEGYFVTGNHTLDNGHYKIEFVEPDVEANKLKSKVFKVNCGQPPALRVEVTDTSSDCINGHGTRTGYVVKEYVWDPTADGGDGDWVLEPESAWSTEWGAWKYTAYTAEEYARLCQTPPPPTKDPVTVTLTDQQSSCERGLEQRTGSQTTSYTWNPTKGAFDEQTGPVAWGSWTFVRDLTDAEFEALGCRPDQPEPLVVELSDERMGCDIGVQTREGTKSTSYVWNADTREYDTVVGAEVWGAWVKSRNLTAAEALDLGCIAGEETVVPKPQPNPKPDRQPAVLGTEASVPTAVAAGLPGDSAASPIQPLGQSLLGLGLLMIAAAGWLLRNSHRRGEHVG